MKKILKNIRWAASSILCAALLTSGTTALAQGQNDLQISLKVEKVLVQNGAEQFIKADKTKPGETVQYTATYHNQSKSALRNLQPHLPIPIGIEYQPDGSLPLPSKASLDGVTFSPYPLKRQAKQADGALREENVPFSEYRALRWSVDELPGGKSLTVVARAKVSTATGAGQQSPGQE